MNNKLDIIELIFHAILQSSYCRFSLRVQCNFCERNMEFRNSNVHEQDVKARNVGRV